MRRSLIAPVLLANLTLLISPFVVWACLNDYEDEEHLRTRAVATFEQTDAVTYLKRLINGDAEHHHHAEEAPADANQPVDFRQLSNRATALLRGSSSGETALERSGKLHDGLAILIKLANEHPEEYKIIANLGTAYELVGRDEDALRCIRKAYQMNPASHEGSEWLHVKILEAKLEMAKDPNWLASHTIVGLEFGSAMHPLHHSGTVKDDLDNTFTLKQVREALEYQLHERISLVPSPDPVVADLLATLGNLLFLEGAYGHANMIYTLALQFNKTPTELLATRIRSTLLLKTGFKAQVSSPVPNPVAPKTIAPPPSVEVWDYFTKPSSIGLIGAIAALGCFAAFYANRKQTEQPSIKPQKPPTR